MIAKVKVLQCDYCEAEKRYSATLKNDEIVEDALTFGWREYRDYQFGDSVVVCAECVKAGRKPAEPSAHFSELFRRMRNTLL